VEGAGVPRLLDRWSGRVAGHAQRAAHRRGDEFAAAPAAARSARTERGDRDVDRILGQSQIAQAFEADVVDDKGRALHLSADLGSQRGEKPGEWALRHAAEGGDAMSCKRFHDLSPSRNAWISTGAPSLPRSSRRVITNVGTPASDNAARMRGSCQIPASSSSVYQRIAEAAWMAVASSAVCRAASPKPRHSLRRA